MGSTGQGRNPAAQCGVNRAGADRWFGYPVSSGGPMYPLKKGKFASQAHVGVPEGTYEEEHGRKGFYGKSAHLYHANTPTGWIRFEGKLRPHCIYCNKMRPTDE